MRGPIAAGFVDWTARVLSVGFLVFTSGRLAGILRAQPTGHESERFEVASVRPSGANPGRPALEFTPGGGVRGTNVTLKMLIEVAYKILPDQLSGGAGWTDSEQYVVIAKAPEGGPALSAAMKRR